MSSPSLCKTSSFPSSYFLFFALFSSCACFWAHCPAPRSVARRAAVVVAPEISCASVASCRRDWRWLGLLRPHCSSWQGRSWELFNSRRIGGSASYRHPRPHAYTYHAITQPGQLCVSAPDKASLLPESTLWGCERCYSSQSFPNIHCSDKCCRRRGDMYESKGER